MREPQPEDITKIKRGLSKASREINKAVDRSSKIDLRPGHVAEAKRILVSIRDEADKFLQMRA
jgi:hypothetical protein